MVGDAFGVLVREQVPEGKLRGKRAVVLAGDHFEMATLVGELSDDRSGHVGNDAGDGFERGEVGDEIAIGFGGRSEIVSERRGVGQDVLPSYGTSSWGERLYIKGARATNRFAQAFGRSGSGSTVVVSTRGRGGPFRQSRGSSSDVAIKIGEAQFGSSAFRQSGWQFATRGSE